MTLRLAGIRTAGFSAVCALILTFAWVPAASAGQQTSTGDAATNPPTAAKTSVPQTRAAKTSPKHHTTSSAASAASGATKSAKTTQTASAGKRSSRRKKSARPRGQQIIDSDRARDIQEALIHEHYLSGEPTSKWNQASEDAMRRYQADHGWQSKTVPDSRALIKLGLGPSKDHLLNPESAMTTGPDAPRAQARPPASPAAPIDPPPAPATRPSDPSSPQ